MSTTEHEMIAVGERLIDAITTGDLDALRGIYSPDVVIWHNNDGLEQRLEQNLAVLGWVRKTLTDMRYDDIRRHATATGFVQQHVLRGTTPDGTPIEVAACLVVTVEANRITRLDEYLDTAQIEPLLAAARPRRA